MSAQEEKLEWPPRAEDLRRLYLVERLSAGKIAQRYGLKYASSKTAESTVLYHLKRAGIKRRNKSEHVRKVTDEMVDEWVRRYQAGESLKQIAGERVGPVTVFNHLRKRGIVLRDKVEAQIQAVTKYEKIPFNGSKVDKAYLLGFAAGDCQALWHGRAVRVRTSSTHPAMAELFEDLFVRSGHVHRYPRLSPFGAEWTLEVDLHKSFDFLISSAPTGSLKGLEESLSFIAGFADAEGSIFLHHKSNGNSFEFSLTNNDPSLLQYAFLHLAKLGCHPTIEKKRQDPKRFGRHTEGETNVLRLWRRLDVIRTLSSLPFRHRERIEKARIALDYMTSSDPTKRKLLLENWTNLREEIKGNRQRFVNLARETISKNSTNDVVSTK